MSGLKMLNRKLLGVDTRLGRRRKRLWLDNPTEEKPFTAVKLEQDKKKKNRKKAKVARKARRKSK